MIKMSVRVFLFTALVGIISCTSQEKPSEAGKFRTFSSENLYSSEEAPRCKFLLDSYCSYLHSPETQGNIMVKRALGPIEILQGNTENEFTQAYYRYSKAKMKNRESLPRDFRRVLDRYNYFGKLQSFLQRPPRSLMSLSSRLNSENSDYELGYIWSAAINEAVILRMSKKFPGYHRLSEKVIPIELKLESQREKRILITEISQALWKNDQNWKRVEVGFERLRESFLAMIPRLDIPEDVQEDWSQRIRDVRLVMPGSLPSIADGDCSTTRSNAYYYTYLNLITVCAGDFNSEDVLLTLSHEMAHALGIDRSAYLFEIRSDFGRALSQFRHNVCEPKSFKCEDWASYKSQFDDLLSSLDGYQPQLPEFNRCLKRRPTSRILGDNDLKRFARGSVSDRVAGLASSNKFLRITKEEIPIRHHKNQKNPNYLNPCSYYLWSQGAEPIDSELTTLLYFTAEYRCSEGREATRIKNAIEVSKEMTTRLMEKTLKIEGEFSARNAMEAGGYASPPYERFADVVGSYAFAQLLSDLPDRWDRQNVFLASSSWQCNAPSWTTHFPEETSIESEYTFSSHAIGDQRRKEIFSLPLRRVIGCEKDFEFNECSLSFKSSL